LARIIHLGYCASPISLEILAARQLRLSAYGQAWTAAKRRALWQEKRETTLNEMLENAARAKRSPTRQVHAFFGHFTSILRFLDT
jgi:hypothetical protein